MYPQHQCLIGDVAGLKKRKVYCYKSECDVAVPKECSLVTGGFPCKDVSTLKRNSDRDAVKNNSKQTGQVLRDILSYIDSCRRAGTPCPALVLENVMGLAMKARQTPTVDALDTGADGDGTGGADGDGTLGAEPEDQALQAERVMAQLQSSLAPCLSSDKLDQLMKAAGRITHSARKAQTKPKGKAKGKAKAKAKGTEKSGDGDSSLDVLRKLLAQKGYYMFSTATSLSEDFGCLQSRRRIYMIAVDKIMLDASGAQRTVQYTDIMIPLVGQ